MEFPSYLHEFSLKSPPMEKTFGSKPRKISARSLDVPRPNF